MPDWIIITLFAAMRALYAALFRSLVICFVLDLLAARFTSTQFLGIVVGTFIYSFVIQYMRVAQFFKEE